MLLALLFACRTAEIVDACDPSDTDALDDTGAFATCIPCTTGAECRIVGNPCLETAVCAHEDVQLAFPDLGCSRAGEHRWPPDETCACADGWCAFAP